MRGLDVSKEFPISRSSSVVDKIRARIWKLISMFEHNVDKDTPYKDIHALDTYLKICTGKFIAQKQSFIFYEYTFSAKYFPLYDFARIISALRVCNVEMSFRHAMGFVLLLLVSRELDLHARKDRANIVSARARVYYADTTDAVACVPLYDLKVHVRDKNNNGDFEYF